jgi:KH domain
MSSADSLNLSVHSLYMKVLLSSSLLLICTHTYCSTLCTVKVTGAQADVEAVLSKVERLIKPYSSGGGRTIECAYTDVGAVIGQRGESIQLLQAQTSTHIQVRPVVIHMHFNIGCSSVCFMQSFTLYATLEAKHKDASMVELMHVWWSHQHYLHYCTAHCGCALEFAYSVLACFSNDCLCIHSCHAAVRCTAACSLAATRTFRSVLMAAISCHCTLATLH